MTKYLVNLSEVQKSENPILELYELFDFDRKDEISVESFYRQLMNLDSNIVIELKQEDVVHDDMLEVIDCFENVQQKNDHVYLIRGID